MSKPLNDTVWGLELPTFLILWAAHIAIVDALMGGGVAIMTGTLTMIAAEF